MRIIFLCASAICGLAAVAPAQITETDDIGRTVRLPARPERIVSLAPAVTEMLFAIGAGDQVAGVTDYCTWPPEAARKPRIGGMINPSLEAIVGLRPDLVVLSMEGNLRDDFRKLEELRIPLLVTNPRSLHDIYSSIALLGKVTGHTENADSVVRTLQAREARVVTPMRVRVEPGVLLIVSLQPLMVAGSGTFLSELLRMAGGRNLAGSSPSTYPQYSREDVVREDPDVLFVLSDAGGAGSDPAAVYPEWKSLRAVRTGRVYRVDADLLSRPGPRAVEGLELLARLLHTKP